MSYCFLKRVVVECAATLGDAFAIDGDKIFRLVGDFYLGDLVACLVGAVSGAHWYYLLVGCVIIGTRIPD